MKKRKQYNYTQPKRTTFTIISLVNKWDVFVDYSCAKTFAPLTSKHATGKHFLTAGSFTKDGADIKLYKLEITSEECTYKDAELYQLAWIRYYIDEGYNVLCTDETRTKALNLSSESQVIYERIPAENKKPEFLRTVSARAKSKVSKKYIQYPYVQLNIRVKDHVKFDFQSYCEEYGFSHNEALSTMLGLASDESKSSELDLLRLIREKEKLINKLSKELCESQNKFSKLHDEVKNHIVPYYINREKAMSSFSRDFFEVFFRDNHNRVKHEDNGTVRREEMHYNYKYPDVSDCCIMVFKFESIAYGEKDKKLFFVFGQDMNGEDIKFRYYNNTRSRYIGIPMDEYDNSHLDNLWYVLYDRSANGVCNIIGSYPIPLQRDTQNSYPVFLPEDITRADIIRDYVLRQQKSLCNEFSNESYAWEVTEQADDMLEFEEDDITDSGPDDVIEEGLRPSLDDKIFDAEMQKIYK